MVKDRRASQRTNMGKDQICQDDTIPTNHPYATCISTGPILSNAGKSATDKVVKRTPIGHNLGRGSVRVTCMLRFRSKEWKIKNSHSRPVINATLRLRMIRRKKCFSLFE
ncbi:hypothetical protein QR680_007335 [Steinernema hermaphroditum]|uniref:Uncharacterized protein n=1 Tax=Steinernema hermaphroditum TaxID=289476 RepID=A0AA39IF32_9BILA|nr:hypothetical protein QR680_007335 [Steinernema hermaphroditum]